MGTIVAGVDGSEGSREALRWALDEARLRGWDVQVVQAWRDPYFVTPGFAQPEDFEPDALRMRAQEGLAATVADVAGDESGVAIEQRVAEGSAATVLVEAAKDADLLVVGSRGHGGFSGLVLGSVSQQCVAHAPCPVLVVRSSRGD